VGASGILPAKRALPLGLEYRAEGTRSLWGNIDVRSSQKSRQGRNDHSVGSGVRLGAVEEWTIVNLHLHDHIFHIHTNPFQLIKVYGQPLAESVWLDTVVLPRTAAGPSARDFSISRAAS
jgi:hypothetical protein